MILVYPRGIQASPLTDSLNSRLVRIKAVFEKVIDCLDPDKLFGLRQFIEESLEILARAIDVIRALDEILWDGNLLNVLVIGVFTGKADGDGRSEEHT